MKQRAFKTMKALLLVLVCFAPAIPSTATSAVALRSRYRVVLAADSRAVYGANRNATECKLFEIGDVYATVSGLAHYGSSFRATDAVRDGFARPGSFQNHVSATAYFLQQRVQGLLGGIQQNNPGEYRTLIGRSSTQSDFVALAVAENVAGQPMLGIVELQHVAGQDLFVAKTAVCPGNCRQGDGLFYLGYWDQIKPYVANSGQPRTVGSAASIDRLIRLEIKAHPAEVGAPINILELSGSGARWLQNGGNCSLPGVGW
jgi:hypothetical protein